MSGFAVTYNSLNLAYIGLGTKLFDRQKSSLLVIGSYEGPRTNLEVNPENLPAVSETSSGEAQFKLELPASVLYVREQVDVVIPPLSGEAVAGGAVNSTTEAVWKKPDEKIVVRGDLFINNIASPDQETMVAITPFIKTPPFTFGPVKELRFRLGPEFSRDLTAGSNALLIRTKIEGSFGDNPFWSGWGIQTDFQANIDGDPGHSVADLSGTYLWVGGILSQDRFIESGIWVGGDVWKGLRTAPADDPAMCLLRVKVTGGKSQENRWWQ
ncbi:MAG: hypothetical protein WC901_07740 [Candidatus Margulisiibacteriota bacterium]